MQNPYVTVNLILKVTVLWDVTSHSLVAIFRHLEETHSSVISVRLTVVTSNLQESQSTTSVRREGPVAYFMMSVSQTTKWKEFERNL
jgi:hypothetical protein